MSMAREIARGLRVLERAQENPVFTWNETDYACVRGARISADQLGAGGFAPQAALILLVRTEVFGDGDRPEKGDTIEFDDYEYILDEIHDSVGLLKFILKDPNRGA